MTASPGCDYRVHFCPYVRQIIYALGTAGGMGIGIATLVIGGLILLTYPLAQLWYTNGVIVGLSLATYLLIGGITIKIYQEEQCYKRFTWGAAWLHYDLLKPLKDALPEREPRTYKLPGLFRQWIRATHDKACPILKFQEEK